MRAGVEPDIAEREGAKVQLGHIDADGPRDTGRRRQRQFAQQPHQFVGLHRLLCRGIARRQCHQAPRDHRIERHALAQGHIRRPEQARRSPILVGNHHIVAEQHLVRVGLDLAGHHQVALSGILGSVLGRLSRRLPVGHRAGEARRQTRLQVAFGGEGEALIGGPEAQGQGAAALGIQLAGGDPERVHRAIDIACSLERERSAQRLEFQVARDARGDIGLARAAVPQLDAACRDHRIGDGNIAVHRLGQGDAGIHRAIRRHIDRDGRPVELQAGDIVAIAQEVDQREIGFDPFHRQVGITRRAGAPSTSPAMAESLSRYWPHGMKLGTTNAAASSRIAMTPTTM